MNETLTAAPQSGAQTETSHTSVAMPSTQPAARLNFLDNLKMILVVLVVAHHAGQPYGPTGGSWPIMHAVKERMLGPFFHTNASFFMGLFFLISAYFLPAAFDRKGPAKFLVDRFLRLGVPLLVFGLVIFPSAGYVVFGQNQSFLAYVADVLFVKHHFEFGHLWFVAHLLVYALGYMIIRRLTHVQRVEVTPRPFPSNSLILAYALALAAVSVVVRIWFPIDRWVFIGVPSEIAHLPQYFSLFVLGVLAYRFDWIARIPARTGRLWLAVGLSLAAARFTYTALHQSFLSWPRHGFEWSSLVWNTWEALLCVGMCIGLLYWFHAHWNSAPGALMRYLNRNAYGVYLFHLHILVGIQLVLERTSYGPLSLTVISTVLTLVVSYALTNGLRRIPGVRRVL
jgi:fucose 4-O-acetylase-like acetyltransferase